MIKKITVLLFVSIYLIDWISAECGEYTNGQCDVHGCIEDSGCTEGDCPCIDSPDAEPVATEGCDESDEENWVVDYMGESTQFRYELECGKDWIKIKMEDLTEYDVDDKKTNNKETSFASSSGGWETVGGTLVDGKIFNTFQADSLSKSGAAFELETIFFVDDVDNQWQNATIPQYSLKFNPTIRGWDYESSDNYLVLCIGVLDKTGGKKKSKSDDNDNEWQLDGFVIENEDKATCIYWDTTQGTDEINVAVSADGNGNNHLDLCFTFDHCEGDIEYDPVLFASSNVLVTAIGFISMFIAILFV